MTLRQLEVFLAVAHAHSYRQAAESLHTSQPALSQHVRELEAELGVRLFDRLSRGVVLTEAGGLLEERAKRVFATLTDVREVLGELQGLQRGSLLVGACRWNSATRRPSSRRSWPDSVSPLSPCTPSVARLPAAGSWRSGSVGFGSSATFTSSTARRARCRSGLARW